MAVHADAAESVLAHAWRETASDEACMHVVVVNIDVEFHAFELSLTGLTDAEVSTTAPSRICRPGKKELLVTAVLLRGRRVLRQRAACSLSSTAAAPPTPVPDIARARVIATISLPSGLHSSQDGSDIVAGRRARDDESDVGIPMPAG